MVTMTQGAIAKVLSIISQQANNEIRGLRISVVGGGCSGFSYSMAFETTGASLLDKKYEFTDSNDDKKKLHIFVDQASLLYLDGVEIDYLETLESSGFKFNNPNVKSTCGCGSSFNA